MKYYINNCFFVRVTNESIEKRDMLEKMYKGEISINDFIEMNPQFLEALMNSNYLLYQLIKDNQVSENQKKTIARYFQRSIIRPTPYGLFAGITTGNFGEYTDFCRKSIAHKVSMIDSEWFYLMIKEIEETLISLEKIKLKYNNQCIISGEKIINPYLCIQNNNTDQDKTQKIIARYTEQVKRIVKLTSEWKDFKEIKEYLMEKNPEVEEKVILKFIKQLIKNFLCILLISFIGYKGKKQEKIVVVISMLIIWAIAEIFIGYFSMMTHTYFVLPEIQGSILSKMLMLFLIVLIKRLTVERKQIEEVPEYWWILMIFPLCSIGIIYFVFKLVENQSDNQIILEAMIASGLFLPLNMLIVNIYDSLQKRFVLEQENIIYKENIRFFTQEIKSKEEYEETRALIHDMKNHFLVIQRMARNNQNMDILGYLKDLDIHYSVPRLVNSGNFIIDTMINSHYTEIKENKIKYKINVIVPEKIYIDDADLCILLGNILDNAVVAASKSEERELIISIIYKKHKLHIGVKNSHSEKIIKNTKNLFVSTKKNKIGHGIGLTLVKRVLEKYDGFENIEYDTNYFVFIAELNEKCDEMHNYE